MFTLAKRNIKLHFKDKSAVLFSFLSVFITLGLYILFLKDTISSKGLLDQDILTHSWMISGLVAVATVTTTLGMLQRMILDKTDKIKKDFDSSPIKKWQVTGGYILSTYVVGVMMSCMTFLCGMLYVKSAGGDFLNLESNLKVMGIILLAVFSSSAMLVFIVSFFKSGSAFSTASTIIGTLIGFLVGTYIPIGALPSFAQNIIKIFPPAHAGRLLREVIMVKPLSHSFKGIPSEALSEYKKFMGIVFVHDEKQISALVSISILAISGMVFYGLGIWNMARKNK